MLIIRWYLKDTCILVTDDSGAFTRTELKMLKDMISPYLYKFRDIGLLYTSVTTYLPKYNTFSSGTPHGVLNYSYSFTRGSMDSYMNIKVSNKHEVLSKNHRNMFKDSSEYIGYLANILGRDVNTLDELVGDVVSVHNDKVVSQCLSTDYVAFLHAHHVVISVEVSSSLLYAKVMGSGYFKTDTLNSLLYDGLSEMALHFSDT